LKNLFKFRKKNENNKVIDYVLIDQYEEIAKLVKEARLQQNLSIKELSSISKIPEQTINSIENNDKNNRPKYPFIRSILFKLENCLLLKKNTLVKLGNLEIDTFKKERKDYVVNKFDIINSWQGILLYFLLLLLTIFILKRYFILNVKVIEIQNIEEKSLIKNLQ
tara:strand:- start:178 stop:672 length:495 start_codon:yes stop_codon:yes gene_type:complete